MIVASWFHKCNWVFVYCFYTCNSKLVVICNLNNGRKIDFFATYKFGIFAQKQLCTNMYYTFCLDSSLSFVKVEQEGIMKQMERAYLLSFNSRKPWSIATQISFIE